MRESAGLLVSGESRELAVLPSRVAYAAADSQREQVTHGQGPYLFRRSSGALFDAATGAGSLILGHGDPGAVQVLADQARKLTVFPGRDLGSEVVEQYAADLVRAFAADGAGRAIAYSSGSDAIEAAIKLAIQYHRVLGRPRKTKVLGRLASYHGATLSGLAAGGFLERRAPFEPVLAASAKAAPAHCSACIFGATPDTCALDCADSVERAILSEGSDTVAAFIAEPVVGAALSAAVPDSRYFARVRAICDRHDVLLVADEVMTGFGRTGRLLALHHWDVRADIVVLGKAMSAGYFPLSGLVVGADVAAALEAGGEVFQNGHTHCCSPLGCAVGSHVLARVRDADLPANAAARGRELLDGMRTTLPGEWVRNIRGLGLMIGFDVSAPSDRAPSRRLSKVVQRLAMHRGLLTYASSGSPSSMDGDHVMLLPPLTITSGDVSVIVSALERTIADLAAGSSAAGS